MTVKLPEGAVPVAERRASERGPWITAVLRCPEVVGTTQHLGLALASYGDADGRWCFPGNRRLARETGRTERTVERCLSELYRLGWLHVQAQPTRRRACVWQLCTPFDPTTNAPPWLTATTNDPTGETGDQSR